MVKNKLVQGVGINDADYCVHKYTLVDGKSKCVWKCPFYRVWTGILERCCSIKLHDKYPTYKGCFVSEEWKTFSNFKAWMETQDWEGKQIDKDLLKHGNKVYDQNHCIFVSDQVNVFITENTALRGKWPIGVCFNKKAGKFGSYCRNPFTGKKEYLGYFDRPEKAHQMWLKRKQELAIQLAAIQTDPRVANALIERYNVNVFEELHVKQ